MDREQLRRRGALEVAIRKADDPTSNSVRLRWASFPRARFPATFPVVRWIHARGLEDLYTSHLVPFTDWVRHVERLVETPWSEWCKPRWILRDAETCSEELGAADHVLGRILATATQTDAETAARERGAEDARALLARLDRDLRRAATERGVARAEREMGAGLLSLQDAWEGVGGPDLGALAADAAARVVARRAALAAE